MNRYFVATPAGMEKLLAEELRGLGIESVAPARSGVGIEATLEQAYRICLWSRLANRVLLPLADFTAEDPEQLYRGVLTVDWLEHLGAESTFAIDFHGTNRAIKHTNFGALRVKDAIVDQLRERTGERPSVARERPDVRINAYLQRNRLRLSLDLSGESLHRRGYREAGAAAPLKENLAAALLLQADWPAVAREGGAFVDPMCGSATLPIEAAMMAADIAPGLQRTYYGFYGWRGHRPELWTELVDEALERRETGLRQLPPVIGYDSHPAAIRAALDNVKRADLTGHVHIERRDLRDARPATTARGLVLVNPPYGERIGEHSELIELYRVLGEAARKAFPGWRLSVFTGNVPLIREVGLPGRRIGQFRNGPLECELFDFRVPEAGEEEPATAEAEMFANRLRKNYRHLSRWARRNGVDCYRVYDADLPEFAVAVDLYQGPEGRWAHLQEYEPPRSVDPVKAELRLRGAKAAVAQVLELPEENIHLKVRRRQKGTAQYEKQATEGRFHEVREGGCRLLVNFTDYLDTGLFLDHRTTRRMLEDLAQDQDFLNLFCYTGSATVHAAVGGARSTTSVDMSATYLRWAERNLALNGFSGPEHRLIRADCMSWLKEQVTKGAGRPRYGVIFLDPPTFSSSKRMEGVFDVQREHVELIFKAAKLLEDDGVLIFSTNFRRFRMDEKALKPLNVEEISKATIPEDFKRNSKIHRSWLITWRRDNE